MAVVDRPSTCSHNGGSLSCRGIGNPIYLLLVSRFSSKAMGLASLYRYVVRHLLPLWQITDSVDVCGFFFQEPSPYTPSPELAEFLESGPPPIYIGFGSIVIDNPEKLVDNVLKAVEMAGVRAIVSQGWSQLAGRPDPNVFYIGDCPHTWLFQHVAAVVHHGGAGTTACGLLNGRPTTIVPFFGEYVTTALICSLPCTQC